jgi:outer membrane protein assembly factor BamD (BamD/ComL family)
MRRIQLVAIVILCALAAYAKDAIPQNLGVTVREAQLYIAPDASSVRLATVEIGREVAVMDHSNDWVQVLANVSRGRQVTGWMLNKGIVFQNTPNGDQILFGEAVQFENEAASGHGRQDAANAAGRLYFHTSEYFPNSPLAAEAMYRAADIRWQLDESDVMSRPSAHLEDPTMRGQINEDYMREVMHKYPHTKWADLAAYHLLENKICGDWAGREKCPEKESDLYESYAKDHPQSPKAPDALYEAARRQAALVDMYKADHDDGKANGAKQKAMELAQRVISNYPQSDVAPRAHTLLFLLQQNIPTYPPNALQ